MILAADGMSAQVVAAAQAAKRASRRLAALTGAERNQALEAMAAALEGAAPRLLQANQRDLDAAASRTGAEALSTATFSRLRLTDAKLQEMVDQVRSVACLPDPLNRILDRIELDDQDPPFSRLETEQAQNAAAHGLHLEKISVPLGVLAVIFEARPDAVTQIAALALKSGNAVLLKPGSEVEHTARALVTVLQGALRTSDLPGEALAMLFGRDQVQALLQAHEVIDMVIPRGSKQLVEYVQANTRIPVLGHSEGVCHIYVDRAADPELALRVVADAKLDYPAACNAVETVLVHQEIAPSFLPLLVTRLQSSGVRLHVGSEVEEVLAAVPHSSLERVSEWHTEYGEPELSLGIVVSMQAAMDHIHTYGSAHTESILTEDKSAAEQFLREVDAAGVFHNASTRFADGFRYGFGAEVGISTSKLHARGPVGLEGLTTYKYVLRGEGHAVGDYRGPGGRAFTHRR